jgi:hypothetical protein
MKTKKILMYLWASPVTLLGLLYVSLFQLFGWYIWSEKSGDAFIWELDDSSAPPWLISLWEPWAGHAIGNIVVLRESPHANPGTLAHEKVHVDQVMRLGIFQPVLYLLFLILIRIFVPSISPYRFNPFEIEARVKSDQNI